MTLLGDILGGKYIFFILFNFAIFIALSSSAEGLLLNLPYIKAAWLEWKISPEQILVVKTTEFIHSSKQWLKAEGQNTVEQ